MEKRLYIAYGSNLNVEQMAQRCPTAKLIGTSSIKNYELIFKRVATIQKKRGSIVPVCVWSLEKSDEEALDLYEGYPNSYGKQDFKINMDGKEVIGMAYVMSKEYFYYKPSQEYYDIIKQGYIDNGLDIKYLEKAVKRTQEIIEELNEQEIAEETGYRWC